MRVTVLFIFFMGMLVMLVTDSYRYIVVIVVNIVTLLCVGAMLVMSKDIKFHAVRMTLTLVIVSVTMIMGFCMLVILLTTCYMIKSMVVIRFTTFLVIMIVTMAGRHVVWP
uniref:Uncharacterized protein n=1 Tax=Spumella elongata TaxID=89044 RepID=A0A7S3MB74_9STRA|mmetsp:Transcript_46241/g.80882  ORF Transcript_46241/g.80882 Transcript_46241/m.80882 type:complete len:111 (+) Transcript_46241:131-463(+)|eukprot:CAMPEP_0184988038 /NCGR_PEP_ID=MMETSP1098-20130426/22754_1 /TAXON_ID=89044 /ORGANISM="Spumella elongata, Strain CCAP 955/1" /LENGTH=110 /DNA_ID=CAMNT_0027512695 /DNA_START=125 /DNA_END=457 /DNA_ORIENTATION=+